MTVKIGQRDGLRGATAGHADKNASSTKDIMAALYNEIADIRTKYDALLAKLDADTGVTDTNYASTLVLSDRELEL